jgi:hypothetical protein
LIPQLTLRLGILKKLSQHSSKRNLRMLASGIFYSKLSYCLPLFVNTWGLDIYRDGMARFTTFTREDNRRLQVLQNQVSRLLITKVPGHDYYYKQNLSTADLLHQCGELSIHQLGAQRTLVMLKITLLSGKPKYLAERLNLTPSQGTRNNTMVEPLHTPLNIRRNGFLYRGIKLLNKLPENIRETLKIGIFKKQVKAWVKENIPVKP